jgi:hypothetical protein
VPGDLDDPLRGGLDDRVCCGMAGEPAGEFALN